MPTDPSSQYDPLLSPTSQLAGDLGSREAMTAPCSEPGPAGPRPAGEPASTLVHGTGTPATGTWRDVNVQRPSDWREV
jgi:hypothetical protein